MQSFVRSYISNFRFYGGVSVDIFFVLSGFVMYLNYSNRIVGHSISIYRYLSLRMFRLYPVYLLSIGVYLLLNFYVGYKSSVIIQPFLLNLLMLQSWTGSAEYVFNIMNPVSWSVSNEMFFYISFFICLCFLKRKKIFIIFSMIYVTVCFIAFFYLKDGLYSISFYYVSYLFPPFSICYFFCGCIAAYIYMKTQKSGIKSYNYYIITSMQILFLISLYLSQLLFPIGVCWYVNIIISILSCSLILTLSLGNNGLLSKLLSTKMFVILGEASYSLYIFHHLIIFLLIPLFIEPYLNNYEILLMLKLILPVILSILIFKFFEKPLYFLFKNKMTLTESK